jgi:hypothetical protein
VVNQAVDHRAKVGSVGANFICQVSANSAATSTISKGTQIR